MDYLKAFLVLMPIAVIPLLIVFGAVMEWRRRYQENKFKKENVEI